MATPSLYVATPAWQLHEEVGVVVESLDRQAADESGFWPDFRMAGETVRRISSEMLDTWDELEPDDRARLLTFARRMYSEPRKQPLGIAIANYIGLATFLGLLAISGKIGDFRFLQEEILRLADSILDAYEQHSPFEQAAVEEFIAELQSSPALPELTRENQREWLRQLSDRAIEEF
jgi:hypothetical protein